MRFVSMCLYVYVIIVRIEYIECDCDTFYECANGFFNDFFNRFASVSSKSTEYFPNVKAFTTNESAFVGYDIESSDEPFDKVISNSYHSTVNDSQANATGASELFKVDLFVPNVNTTVFIKNIQNELDAFRANLPNISFLGDADKVDIKTDIPFSITYENNTFNIEHDDLTEVVVKTNTINTMDYDAEDRSRSLSILDEILLNYEDADSDNSTDYSIMDYVQSYADRIEEVDYKEDDMDITTTAKIQNLENVTKELKQDFENFIENFDDDHRDLLGDDKKNRSLSKSAASVKNHTELRICDGNEFSGNVEDAIFSWTAAIFLKESNRTDFVYACDGVTLSQRHVVAVKKCFNYTTSKGDILLVVGKRSLRNIGEREAAYKVERMVFQNGTERNDLVLLETGTDIDFNRYVQAACISSPGSIAPVNYEQAIAIGYNTTNDLSILDLTVDSPGECLNEKSDTSNGTTKLVYCMRVQGGNATCPNLGSVFASKSTIPSKIKLLAILTDTSDDCHTKLSFTSLLENLRWLEENVTS